ncbi:hypothetical protein C2869_21090 [Saccharobesus litoralis]|uniref:Cell division protein FtsQ n=2 Tax=Saccharobesus litoralis TaxID=2172099 RepID=A0A2S0VY18_9ALTE|nr:hypothetical protein C2869_21090 [Saccharobesus litoralis]
MPELRQQIEQAGWPFWAGLVFFFWVLIGSLWLIEYVSEWLVDENRLPVKQIVVQGQQDYLTKQDVLQALELQMSQSFFALNVDKAQQQLEALDWIYSVSVRKEWPNRLKIYITEQNPQVHWNGDFLLNEYGDVFQADTDRLQRELAWLFGPEGDENQVLETYQKLSELMALYHVTINEMSLSERHALQITLKDGVKLNLGREDWLNRSQRFLQHYPQLKRAHNLDYVDLRYDTGFAVGLKQNNEDQS